MLKSTQLVCLAFLGLLLFQCAPPAEEQESSSQETEPTSYDDFEDISVRFEQNATDGDVEAVFEITAGDEGMKKLTILSPDGQTTADFSSPAEGAMGIRKFVMESPEPTDKESLKKAFPEGVYQFTAIDVEGNGYKGQANLSHQLPNTVSIQNPEPESEGVATEGLEIKWSPVEGLDAYIVEIESEEEDVDLSISAKVAGTATSFAVPEGFLIPDVEFKVSVGTVSEEGNISFVESAFVTAGDSEGEEDE